MTDPPSPHAEVSRFLVYGARRLESDVQIAREGRPHFVPFSSTRGHIDLTCQDPGQLNDVVEAYISGILVGSVRVDQRFGTGDILKLPVTYLPFVDLPAKILFQAAQDEWAVSDPFDLATNEDAVRLIGSGSLNVDNLRLENGLLRGDIVNAINGLFHPVIYGQVNGGLARQVTVEPPRLREEGGSICQFAMQLRLNDLSENGLIAALHVVGQTAPVAIFSYQRADLGETDDALIDLRQRLRTVERSVELQIAALTQDCERKIIQQQERFDAFSEYVLGQIFDNFARVRLPGDRATTEDILAGFEQSLSQRRSQKLPVSRSPHSPSVEIDITSASLNFGWYNVEYGDENSFRWMGAVGLIANPFPNRPLSCVTILASHVYSVDQPLINASLDDNSALVEIEKVEGEHLVKVTSIGGSKACEMLRLESLASGCPAQEVGGDDDRVLSIAVTKILFHYADTQ